MNRVAGRYEIVEALGGGGTSLVHRARVLAGGPDVALKQLRPQFAADAAIRRRFLREAELVRQLDHPGIVRCVDAGTDAGVPFVVMELVSGRTLRQVMDSGGKLDLLSARSLFIWLARALDHAHGRGIIHRDVKPQNVFVTDDGPRLSDFGNARVVSLASVTGASLTWGTPEYVAPEVFTRGRADPRSDLYSLGVVLYEMLTGGLPWSRAETLTRLAGRAGTRASFAPTGYGGYIDDLIADLLAFSPLDRPASGEEAVGRFSPSGAVALAPKTTCSACGAPRAEDVPCCFSCGAEALRLRHQPEGGWRLVLRRLDDDAATTERLLRLLESIAQPVSGALHFLTGNRSLYSETESMAGIAIPAVLFSELDEATARSLEALFRHNQLDAQALAGTTGFVAAPPKRAHVITWVAYSVAVVLMLGRDFGAVAFAVGAAVVGAIVTPGIVSARRRLRRDIGLLALRDRVTALPVADRLLAEMTKQVASVRAPEVRALVAATAAEIYRLSRRAEMLAGADAPSSAADVFSRTAEAAPVFMVRLQRIAARLDDLDTALEGQSEGEIMQALARLERAAAAPGADRDALAAACRDLDAALERRHAAEQERAQLSAKLCHLLGRLRLVYRQAASAETLQDREAHALEAAAAELDAFLAAASSH